MFWVCRKIANALFWLSVTHIFSATSQNNDTTMNIGIKVYVFEMDKKHVSTRSRPTICGHIAEASWKTSRCLKHARVNPMKIGYVPSQKCLLTDQKYTPNVSIYSIHGSYVFFWVCFCKFHFELRKLCRTVQLSSKFKKHISAVSSGARFCVGYTDLVFSFNQSPKKYKHISLGIRLLTWTPDFLDKNGSPPWTTECI